ncbi:alpha/beta hydrolase family esterase [Cupriavidus pampae]|uniref:Poly(3-hydroxybutyrate) depolymerase n=1 Tax=Cupriavidus pampae TaxID=659251 RepID=A0ABN7ZR15_9BURK|nr:hypothetical protein LMG32289_06470 [Cupriavidus pampae]
MTTVVEPSVPPHAVATGHFSQHTFANQAGQRSYKVYVPAADARAEPMPLVVMLHGCTQDANDFAAGTRMNNLADDLGFVVVYPIQSPAANTSKCWNWFRPGDQCVFRPNVTGRFGIVTGDFGNVTERTGRQDWRCA